MKWRIRVMKIVEFVGPDKKNIKIDVDLPSKNVDVKTLMFLCKDKTLTENGMRMRQRNGWCVWEAINTPKKNYRKIQQINKNVVLDLKMLKDNVALIKKVCEMADYVRKNLDGIVC